MVTSIVLERANGSATANLRVPSDWAFGALMLAPAAAGALTLRRGARPVVGWLLVAATTGMTTHLLLHAVAVTAARHGEALPWLVWPALWLAGPSAALICLVPGRLAGGLAQRAEPVAIAAIVAVGLAQAFGSDPLSGVGPAIEPLGNPASIAALASVADVTLDVAEVVLIAYLLVGMLALVRAALRRGQAERTELPWLVLAAILLPGIAVAAIIGKITGLGAFETAWWVGVLVPLVVLAATSAVAARGWLAARRESEQLQYVARAREDERARVRRDLHDGIGPALAGMRLKLELLRDGLPPEAQVSREAADQLEASLDETLGELRRIVDGMQPAALETVGFRGALELLQASLTSTWPLGGAVVDVEVDPELPELPSSVAAILLRVCAEALSNAVRHADPTRCRISVGWADGAARLEVVDDGIGLPAREVRPGVGLRSMRDRVEEIGGTLEVSGSESGQGTAVTAVVPVRG
jgi:signal transduction histidine kinase